MENNNSANAPKSTALKSLVAFLFVALFVFLGMYRLQPPQALSTAAPLTAFSAERAAQHLAVIAQEPRPPASPEHDRVRDYILSELAALGLTTEVQDTEIIFNTSEMAPSGRQFAWATAGRVENILARLEGTDSSKAILIAGHYDSVFNSLNVSDGGSSIAVALETARALKAGPPLKNDVIFLLTDVEENGLLGSIAFINQHPWAKDIGIVLHFTARGTGGPAIMFETSPGNGWLIEQFAQSAPHPIANSLAYEVYQLLPNITDFTRYRQADLAGFNFAYIDRSAYYHTMLDNLENLDERSLQHEGLQALALTRHLGNLNLENVKKQNAVYFDLWGLTMIHYPETWVLPLTLVVALLYLGVMLLGLKRKRLTFLGVGLGALVLLLALLGAYVMTTLLERAILSLHSEYRLMFQGNLYNSHLYLVSFIALSVALTSALYGVFQKKTRRQNLIAGGLSIWLILALATAFLVPGTSYLFAWPLLFSLLALGITFVSENQEANAWPHLALFALGAIPGLVLLVPTIYLIYIALPPLALGGLAVAMLVTLLLGALIPHLAFLTQSRTWLLPAAAAVVGIAFLVAGSLTASFTPERPKQVSIVYGLKTDIQGSKEATWVSSGSPTDEWTTQFFPNGATPGDPSDFYGSIGFFLGPAPVVSLPTPSLTVLNDQVSNGVRKLHLSVSAPQPALFLQGIISIEPDTVLSARLNGNDIRVGPKDRWLDFFRFFYLPALGQKLELELETTSSQPMQLRVEARFYGLPQIPGHSFNLRQAYMVPSPNDRTNTTFVRQTFELAAP